jgi:hypothetical protein
MVGGNIVRRTSATSTAFNNEEEASYDFQDLRAQVKRPQDNLKMEGEFQNRSNADWVPASKPSQFRPVDNLVPPGPVEGRSVQDMYASGERAGFVRRSDNLTLQGR